MRMKSIMFLLVLLLLIIGCKEKRKDSYKSVNVEFHLAEADSADGLMEYAFRGGIEKFYLHNEVLSDNSDIADVSVEEMNDEFVILLKFTEEGKIKWSKITGENIGKKVGILIDQKLVTAPIIRARIDQGKAIINGDFTKEEAEIIAEGIKTK